MNIPAKFGFYAVLTDPIKGYEYLTKLLVDNETAFVQLRMKNASLYEIEKVAHMMKKITEGTKTRFIVNDHPDIVMKTDADGVHIGQDDQPYEKVRALLGPDKIIGVSTHSPLQTELACKKSPDYIGVGPVFPTPTKKNPDPVIGLEGMEEMLKRATVPAVCIGGIDLQSLADVLKAGGENFCMVRQLTQSDDPQKVLDKISEICSGSL
ncbi:Thiamin-phosphate pyrophosphorylase [Chitinispirillum alkaliphilum]|nr:Thiamin-phosphate pyrophosphorylase [Chitinispirillum alkaliphilum]